MMRERGRGIVARPDVLAREEAVDGGLRCAQGRTSLPSGLKASVAPGSGVRPSAVPGQPGGAQGAHPPWQQAEGVAQARQGR
jgi:hypothetical protein